MAAKAVQANGLIFFVVFGNNFCQQSLKASKVVVPLHHSTTNPHNPAAMTPAETLPAALAAALATLHRATARMEAAASGAFGPAYLLAQANFHAAFDAVEVLKTSQRPAPRR